MRAAVLSATTVAECEVCHKPISSAQVRAQNQGFAHDRCVAQVQGQREDQ